MRELILPRQRKFHRDPERFNRHNGDRAHCRANREVYQGVLLPVFGRNAVYHYHSKDRNRQTEQQEPFFQPPLADALENWDGVRKGGIPGWIA